MTVLHLAVELDGDGAHPAAWRRAQHGPSELLTARRTERVARRAENAGFTLATFDDAITPPGAGPLGRIGAVERAAFVAPLTTSIGLAPVVATTYTEPFHVASQLASLDHASLGRAGWVVAAGTEPHRAWGRPPVTGDGLAREARDAVTVARDLFDSWGDDAAIRDVTTGRYLDRAQLHYIDFVGETYSVKGPAIVPRPPQGHVVVIAPHGLIPDPDVALVTTPQRVPDAPLTFLELEVALDTDVPAEERLAALDAHTPWPRTGRPRHVGSAESLVERLRGLAGTVDGVRLHPLVLDEDLPVLSARVLPALFESRTATRPRAGASLRTTLGLPRPANRFEVAS
ncbi:Luciferase-like monooxygenase [Pseudonocardia thermophila]|uniref:Luciferase-like monooxygenase n=1 Tax=Pseudonocardia thermophila TaxID=1848 RepID=A0A1M6SYB0_PSETH|nr:LLM class flavin-dependent oxidoreductase [Pseudonocardia thermophila]SHK49637.1 Luciferase-like monooxygenase [Pseudonocardia thermophila]